VGDCGWNEFGVDGYIALTLTGSLTGPGGALHITPSSIDGTVTASLNTAFSGTIQWPTLFGDECTIEYGATVTGDLAITSSGGQTSATGEVSVHRGNGKTKDFQMTFNNL